MGAELVARGLRRTFDARTAPVRALRGVDLTVHRGELVASMGPSGCGRSTSLHVLAGPEPADEGSIESAGLRLDGLGGAAPARPRRRHVGIARALADRPTLLPADEPTGALDSAGALEVLDLFHQLNARRQTILMVTHSAEVAVGASRIVSMRDGRIATSTPVPAAPSSDLGPPVASWPA